MSSDQIKVEGYLYILTVRDIDLPVCKIGMTQRTAYERCAEINKSSTGDFIWEVAHQLAVSDCRAFESLIHKKLTPFRQKNREFFNITADVALTAVRSILHAQTEILEMPMPVSESVCNASPAFTSPLKEGHGSRKNLKRKFQARDSQYAGILQTFAALLHIKGRPFGQLSQPVFGLSDGVPGVQWNIGIFPESEEVRVGVNLEGMKYNNWPIADFILSELDQPSIESLKSRLDRHDPIVVSFMRDAWQVQSRPEINEKYLGVGPVPLQDMTLSVWNSMLVEARDCLAREKGFRGRATQGVTFVKVPKSGVRSKVMAVSPHLTIYLPLEVSSSTHAQLESGVDSLLPVHEWLASLIDQRQKREFQRL